MPARTVNLRYLGYILLPTELCLSRMRKAAILESILSFPHCCQTFTAQLIQHRDACHGYTRQFDMPDMSQGITREVNCSA